MAAIPELQNPGRTTLSLRDIAACFRLKLWDPEQGRMVGYPGAGSRRGERAAASSLPDPQ
jgi:omega-6 fatty acid desaturase (delta-12 desaturase)